MPAKSSSMDKWEPQQQDNENINTQHCGCSSDSTYRSKPGKQQGGLLSFITTQRNISFLCHGKSVLMLNQHLVSALCSSYEQINTNQNPKYVMGPESSHYHFPSPEELSEWKWITWWLHSRTWCFSARLLRQNWTGIRMATIAKFHPPVLRSSWTDTSYQDLDVICKFEGHIESVRDTNKPKKKTQITKP